MLVKSHAKQPIPFLLSSTSIISWYIFPGLKAIIKSILSLATLKNKTND